MLSSEQSSSGSSHLNFGDKHVRNLVNLVDSQTHTVELRGFPLLKDKSQDSKVVFDCLRVCCENGERSVPIQQLQKIDEGNPALYGCVERGCFCMSIACVTRSGMLFWACPADNTDYIQHIF